MPKRSSKKQPAADENVSAFDAVAKLTGQRGRQPTPDELRSQAAAILGSLGGKKGGAARAKSLSPKKRSEIAKKAAEARWKGEKR